MERVSRTLTNGFLETIFLMRGAIPSRTHHINEPVCRGEIDDNYSISVKLLPNGFNDESREFMALLLAINSKNENKVCAKFECSVLMVTGRKRYQFLMCEMDVFEFECFRLAKEIVSIQEILDSLDILRHGDYLMYELKITIDTRQEIPDSSINYPKELIEKLTNRFYDPTFGDTGFIVGGVKIYGHKELLFKNSVVIKDTLQDAPKLGLYYDLPDLYPQIFVNHMLRSYLPEKKFCKKCFRYRVKKVDTVQYPRLRPHFLSAIGLWFGNP